MIIRTRVPSRFEKGMCTLNDLFTNLLVRDRYNKIGEVYIEIVGWGDFDGFYPVEVFRLRCVVASSPNHTARRPYPDGEI